MNGEAFVDIYRRGVWGGGSGTGSAPSYCAKYVEHMRNALRGARVLDLGCGDMRVALSIADVAESYVGVDVAIGESRPTLRHVREDFSAPGAVLRLLDEHRPTDAILKDVLQHWTDEEIAGLVAQFAESRHWDRLWVANSCRWNRVPSKNLEPRRPTENRYRMAPLPGDHPVLSPLGPQHVMHYPRRGLKELVLCRRREK